MTETKRIETPWDLMNSPLLSEKLRNVLKDCRYVFTPQNEDGEDLEECEACFSLTRAEFDPLSSNNAGEINRLVSGALSAFEEESGELGVTVYRNDADPADYIMDILVTDQGPVIWARYERRDKRLTITAGSGSNRVELTAEEYGIEGTPIAELIERYEFAC